MSWPLASLVHERGSTSICSLKDQLVERDTILDELKFYLLQAQNALKLQEDKKRREVHLDVGDLVYYVCSLTGNNP